MKTVAVKRELLGGARRRCLGCARGRPLPVRQPPRRGRWVAGALGLLLCTLAPVGPAKAEDAAAPASPAKTEDAAAPGSPAKAEDAAAPASPAQAEDVGAQPSPAKAEDVGAQPSPAKAEDAAAQPSPAKAEAPWPVRANHLELGAYLGLMIPPKGHELYDAKVGVWEPLSTVGPQLGIRVGGFPLTWSGAELEAEYTLLKTEKTHRGAAVWRTGANLVFQIPGRFTFFGVLGAGLIGTRSARLGPDADGELHWGLGMKSYMTRQLGLRLDFRQVLAGTYKGSKGRSGSWYVVNLGVSFALWRHGVADRDGDGIADAVDACPDTAGVASDGCADQDEDGVSDRQDRCPDVVGSAADGCPPDGDKDGVPDAVDACPDEAGVAEKKGCPAPDLNQDRDRDGIPDRVDACPDTPGTLSTGCVDPDPDKDGVLGADDACPTQAGAAPTGCPAAPAEAQTPAAAGLACPPGAAPTAACPAPAGTAPEGAAPTRRPAAKPPRRARAGRRPKPRRRPAVGGGVVTGVISGIRFHKGSAQLTHSSFRVLNRTVSVLKRRPKLRIRVEVHTDNQGSQRTQLRLSKRRAATIRRFLIESGIKRSRVRAVGYGGTKPRASNRSASGRAKNRRVVFRPI